MFKIILSVILAISISFADGVKPNGCDLSVVGDVELSVDSKNISPLKYKAISKSGKNFHAILVGSTMSTEAIYIEILDIKANKRVKREARTGTIKILLKTDDNSENIDMSYRYTKGIFSAKAKQKNKKEISFRFEIKALLCHI